MGTIDMYWYKSSAGRKNFGDELGPFIVQELTGRKVKYVPIVNNPFKGLALYLLKLKQGTLSLRDFMSVISGLKAQNVLFSVGSIISYNGSKSSKVWGSGLIDSRAKVHNANFLAVRGKYTQQRLKELGYNAPDVFGDPALLLPLIIKPHVEKRYKLGIIPHHIHFNEVVTELKNNEDILVVDLTKDIDTVINDINSCERTISSSLHGIIVSHSYSIPCLWCNFSDKKLSGDGIKFKDYFSSVNIREHHPFRINLKGVINIDAIIDMVDKNNMINKANIDILQLQRRLLSVAPFEMKQKYRLFIEA